MAALSTSTTSDEYSSLLVVDENDVAKISDSNNNNNNYNDENVVDSVENWTAKISNNTGNMNTNNNNSEDSYNQQNSVKKDEKEKHGILKKTSVDGQANGSAIQEQNAKDNHNGHSSNGFINRNGENHRKLAQKMDSSTIASIEEILDVMDRINRAVKAGQFSPILASLIFKLCDYLKKNGENMENTHKNELNQTFVSIRQACCRDSGQLGTPCRLKMMELVELRAMKWMPNLSHSQYYMEKSASLEMNGSATTIENVSNESITSPPPTTSSCRSPGLPDAHRSPKPPTTLVAPSPVASMQLPPTAMFVAPGYHPYNFHHHRTSVGANEMLAATGPALTSLNAAAAQTHQPYYHVILAPGAPPPGTLTFTTGAAGGAAAAGLLPTPTAGTAAPLIHHPMAPNFSMPATISPLTAAALNAKTMTANKLASK